MKCYYHVLPTADDDDAAATAASAAAAAVQSASGSQDDEDNQGLKSASRFCLLLLLRLLLLFALECVFRLKSSLLFASHFFHVADSLSPCSPYLNVWVVSFAQHFRLTRLLASLAVLAFYALTIVFFHRSLSLSLSLFRASSLCLDGARKEH